MQKYPNDHWKALGKWVGEARLQAGYLDMKDWAAEVGRSVRQLQGLERGDEVGPKTIARIAAVLGVANWSVFNILVTGVAEDPWGEMDIESARNTFEQETGLKATRDYALLETFSNEELACRGWPPDVRRRCARCTLERARPGPGRRARRSRSRGGVGGARYVAASSQ